MGGAGNSCLLRLALFADGARGAGVSFSERATDGRRGLSCSLATGFRPRGPAPKSARLKPFAAGTGLRFTGGTDTDAELSIERESWGSLESRRSGFEVPLPIEDWRRSDFGGGGGGSGRSWIEFSDE